MTSAPPPPALDLAVVGPSQVELCFGDLPRMPVAGEELFSTGLVVRPRSAALTAIAAERLGLRTALGTPLGEDFPGQYLRHLLQTEHVRWLGPSVERSGLLVDFGVDCGPAVQMTTQSSAVPWQDAQPRAIAGTPPWLRDAPRGKPRYALVDGTEELAAIADLEATALLGTEDAACRLAGDDDLTKALLRLAPHWPTVVVDLGQDGVAAVTSGATVRLDGAPRPRHPLRLAHSLFVAAYVWADLQGLDLLGRLRWAALHAARGDVA
ncbi:MAG: carbohydrate kinase family protein [Candidatus Dormiibacterota bacterium]